VQRRQSALFNGAKLAIISLITKQFAIFFTQKKSDTDAAFSGRPNVQTKPRSGPYDTALRGEYS